MPEPRTRRTYDKLEDGTYAGRIPDCPGVIAFGGSLRECESELPSTLEDWILLGLQMGHPLPVLAGIDLNKEPAREPVDAKGIRWMAQTFSREYRFVPRVTQGRQPAPSYPLTREAVFRRQ